MPQVVVNSLPPDALVASPPPEPPEVEDLHQMEPVFPPKTQPPVAVRLWPRCSECRRLTIETVVAPGRILEQVSAADWWSLANVVGA
jgi:hypothetical protein